MENSGINEIDKILINENEIIINWIGQAGFVFKNKNNTIICVDPYYSNSIERHEGAASRRIWFNKFDIEKFNPDLVICTHDHLDHTDPDTIPLLNSYSNAIFYGPKSSIEHMKKMNISPNRLKIIEVGKIYIFKDIKIKPVFANHTIDSCGIILYFNDLKIYITGDTCLDYRLYKIAEEQVDILILCINGKFGNLSIKDSIRLFKKIKAKKIIPMHYGLIPTNTVNIYEFINICNKENINFSILDIEKNYIIKKFYNDINCTICTI